MKPKISLKQLPGYIKNKTNIFNREISDNGGGSYYCRAIVAQCLLFFCYYSVSIKLIPINNFVNSHIFLISSWILIIIIWKAIKNKIHPWIQEIISGEIFYVLDYIALNICIVILCFINIFIFIPFNFKNIKENN